MRITLVALALALAAGCTSSDRGDSSAPDPAAAPALTLAWTAGIADGTEDSWAGPTTSSAPVASGSVLYVGSADGNLYAFPLDCAPTESKTCEPLWRAKVGDRIASTPAVGGGAVFVVSKNGRLSSFPTDCPSGTCEPLWQARLGSVRGRRLGGSSWSSPLLFAHRVFVVITNEDQHSRLLAYPIECHTPCDPEPQIVEPRRQASPGNEHLWIPWETHLLAITCGKACWSGVVFDSAADFPGRETYFYTTPSGCEKNCDMKLGGFDLGSPTVAEGKVFIPVHDQLVALSEECTDSPCDPLWVTSRSDTAGSTEPVASSGNVFLPTHMNHIAIVPTDCVPLEGVCESVGSANYSGTTSAPAGVGSGLAAVSLAVTEDKHAKGGLIAVFSQECPVNCDPLWSAPIAGPGGLSAPTIVEDRLFVSAGGQLYAYDICLPCVSAQIERMDSPTPSAPKQDVEAAPVPEGWSVVKLPGMSLVKPDDWYVTTSDNGRGLGVSSAPPGMVGPACNAEHPDMGVLYVEPGHLAMDEVQTSQWPAKLIQVPDELCPRPTGEYYAEWIVDGDFYRAFADIGPGPGEQEHRRAVFSVFDSIRFPDASYEPWPLPENEPDGLFIDGGDSGPHGPWTLTMNADLRYATEGDVTRLGWVEPDEGFAGAKYVSGGPIFGIVVDGTAAVRFDPDKDPSIDGVVYSAPHTMGYSIFTAEGPAFLVDVPADAGAGALVSLDADGQELGRLRVSPGD